MSPDNNADGKHALMMCAPCLDCTYINFSIPQVDLARFGKIAHRNSLE